jgi:transposase
VVRAKSGDAHAEALRALLVPKRSARSARITTIVQLRHLMFTAPDDLRARLGSLTATQLSTGPPGCAHDLVAMSLHTG